VEGIGKIEEQDLKIEFKNLQSNGIREPKSKELKNKLLFLFVEKRLVKFEVEVRNVKEAIKRALIVGIQV
jgi:hypothetical protein